ncbi:hypothetical protein M3Y95_00192500 [Aphelenchoides besseyi]|nr:hypothetical protein M3Y95_00192500 [Aphelenchoides besseyi]
MPLRYPTSNDPGRRFSQPTRRKLWTLLGIAVVLLLFIGFQLAANEDAVDFSHYYAILESNQTENGKCKIPVLEPWDETIRPYIKNAPPLECRQVQPTLTFLHDSRVFINKSAVVEAGYSLESIRCEFRCFERGADDDHNFYHEWVDLKNGSEAKCEFVEVNCKRRLSPLSFYTQFHAQIIRQNESQSESQIKRYSVSLFVLDSVSQSHWHRGLPKTLNVLKSTYNTTVLTGFNKVADNSFPNAIAFLKNYNGVLPTEAGNSNYEDWPLIWKDFKRQNYSTYYAEDYVDFNLFNYLSKGFSKKPVDHYFRPFWLKIYGSFVRRRSKFLCYNDDPMHMLQVRYFEQLIQNYDDKRPFFALNWFTELAHDWLSQVSSADEDFENLLRKNVKHLKNTFFFMFSDHGHRFDAIRQTMIGRIEERMPFFSMHVPEELVEKIPELQKTLKWNSKQLTSFFDLYVTMRDILDLQKRDAWYELKEGSQPVKRFRSFTTHGLSLLRPLPSERTCEEAGIPHVYCICQTEREVNVNDSLVKRVADKLVEHVNQLLYDHRDKCERLELKKIYNAHISLPNDGVVHGRQPRSRILPVQYDSGQPRGFYLNYGVMIEVSPSAAMLEGIAVHSFADDTIQIKGDVNRINRYANQSACIREATLRKYCFCK